MPKAGSVVGSIPDLKASSRHRLVSDLGRGFISDGGADEAVVFDLKTLKSPTTLKPVASRLYHLRFRSKHIFHHEWQTTMPQSSILLL